MDHWDPAVTDGFAKDREVILFNNAGVSGSSGEVPTTLGGMGLSPVGGVALGGASCVSVMTLPAFVKGRSIFISGIPSPIFSLPRLVLRIGQFRCLAPCGSQNPGSIGKCSDLLAA